MHQSQSSELNFPAIKIEELRKHFKKTVAVDGISIDIPRGEIFGLLGPNGAGKSTTINMITAFIKPDNGRVLINGIEVKPDMPQIKRMIGICPQSIILWPKLTCLEQLLFIGRMYGMGGVETKERALRLLSDLELSEKKDKLAGTLSGGMQRRMNILLALIHDPEILILDEPEAGLDPQSRALVREYIKSLASKKTVVFTSHNMDEVERICDRIAIIDRGRMLVTGAPDEIKKKAGNGDILEIEMPDKSELSADIKALLNGYAPDFAIEGNILILRSCNILKKAPQILDALKSGGIITGEIKLRENSLEDVFISLTGRRLRE